MKSSLKVLVLDPLSISSLSGSSCRKHPPNPCQGWKIASGLVRFAGEGQSPGDRVVLGAEVIAEARDRWRDTGEHGYSIWTPSPRRLPWVNLLALVHLNHHAFVKSQVKPKLK